MATKPKRTNVKSKHKDSAAKNTMNSTNPPAGRVGMQEEEDLERREMPRRVGQFTGSGSPPMMKK